MSEDNQTQSNNENAAGASDVITLPPRCRVNMEIIMHLDVLLDFAPPQELKNDLLNVFMHFLMHEGDALPEDFKDVTQNYLMLFDWLDTVDEEMKKRGF
jgi:hypothetical protein